MPPLEFDRLVERFDSLHFRLFDTAIARGDADGLEYGHAEGTAHQLTPCNDNTHSGHRIPIGRQTMFFDVADAPRDDPELRCEAGFSLISSWRAQKKGSMQSRSRVDAGLIQRGFGVDPASMQSRSMVDSEPIQDPCRVDPKSMPARSKINPGPMLNRSRASAESIQGRFRVDPGSIQRRSSANAESIQGRCRADPGSMQSLSRANAVSILGQCKGRSRVDPESIQR